MRAMIIDFHTHSNASDGKLAPADLLQEALAAGIEQLALTDHDCVDGYLALKSSQAAADEGLKLHAGVELSCRWHNDTVHIVGLGIDVEEPGLVAGLDQLAQARQKRAGTIAERLEKLGFEGALEGAIRHAGVSQIGRPHFARWMVEQGHVSDMNAAFDKYLGAGKTGDVKAFWPELDEAVSWISGAAGIPVLAHPLKYRYTRSKLRRLVRDFCDCGGQAIEIYSGRQLADQTEQLRKLAKEFGLLASAGSDFHGQRDYGPTLGVDVSSFERDDSTWQVLAARAVS